MMKQSFNLVELLTTRRGQSQIIWICNIGAERYWNRVNPGVIDRNEDIIVNRIEEMNLLLCRKQDFLILRQMPDQSCLQYLQELGFSVPTILVPNNADLVTPISELVLQDEALLARLSHLAQGDETYFLPYAITRLEEEIASKTGLTLAGSPANINATVNDKIYNRQIAEELGFPVCKGKVCNSVGEITQVFQELTGQPPYFQQVIIKEPFGASGKGLYIVADPERLKMLLLRLARFARNQENSRWLVEGWYPKKADLNYQLYVSPEGKADVFSVKEQLLRDSVYIGSRMPAELDPVIIDRVNECGIEIGKYLHRIGYSGVAGVDAIVTSDGTLIPIIEINGRFTLSTYISFIQTVLGKAKILSRYFRLMTDFRMDYQTILAMLKKEGLLYDSGTAEGVLVYVSGTLSAAPVSDGGIYSGRLFGLIIAADWERVNDLNGKLEDLIRKISMAEHHTLEERSS